MNLYDDVLDAGTGVIGGRFGAAEKLGSQQDNGENHNGDRGRDEAAAPLPAAAVPGPRPVRFLVPETAPTACGWARWNSPSSAIVTLSAVGRRMGAGPASSAGSPPRRPGRSFPAAVLHELQPRNDRSALTVVNRSSTNRIGTVLMRGASASASATASSAEAPARFARVRGSPTTTSTAWNSSTRSASRRRVSTAAVAAHGLHRGGQQPVGITGRHPDADLAHVDTETPPPTWIVFSRPIGQPILPGASPHPTPGHRLSLGPVRHEPLTARRRCPRILSGALSQVGLPTAAPAQCCSDKPDEVIGPDADVLSGLVGGHHKWDAVRRLGDEHDDAGSESSRPRMSPTRSANPAAVIPAGIRCATKWTLPTLGCTGDLGRTGACLRQAHTFEFSAPRSRSTRVATRPGTSSEGTLSEDARPAISARSLARCRNESKPT